MYMLFGVAFSVYKSLFSPGSRLHRKHPRTSVWSALRRYQKRISFVLKIKRTNMPNLCANYYRRLGRGPIFLPQNKYLYKDAHKSFHDLINFYEDLLCRLIVGVVSFYDWLSISFVSFDHASIFKFQVYDGVPMNGL